MASEQVIPCEAQPEPLPPFIWPAIWITLEEAKQRWPKVNTNDE